MSVLRQVAGAVAMAMLEGYMLYRLVDQAQIVAPRLTWANVTRLPDR